MQSERLGRGGVGGQMYDLRVSDLRLVRAFTSRDGLLRPSPRRRPLAAGACLVAGRRRSRSTRSGDRGGGQQVGRVSGAPERAVGVLLPPV